ncbi:hypothetical protein ADL22_00825 [Streptomyces sp. NRRL F-4489]|uniref:hypothetical protein n=1 Tax=Streptomyces sp. NRRL F-4489 TaxID=1609095 RepID=UPI0007465131|nr:hypothetical protein [Streptomyces sp. NRRL F-4489]KUL55469.1 hypothetical protein ADL22_00825 [Streptomyces sp. NRRL F-4489]
MASTAPASGREDPDLAALCAQFGAVRRAVRGTPLADELADGLAAVRDGAPAGDLLARLGIAPAGQDRDAWGGAATVAGLDAGHSHGERYGCPAGRCGRAVVREPGGELPRCAVLGSVMRLLAD